ncbi:MAG TPA: ABC transporter ATP-binding protein [Kineosporiaceae bacterium]|nr:ABC transporter ATP-binding protein [Kineosporiaceae bacterium]
MTPATPGTDPPPGTAPRPGAEVRLDGVVHIYTDATGSDVVALRGVDLEVSAGERVALLGPSGAGKSTLLSLLAGTTRASAGTVTLDGLDLRTLSEGRLAALRAARVGTVLQGPWRNLLPYATAAQNVSFAQRALSHRVRRTLTPPADLLGALGLAPLAHRPLAGLSGGERQRIAVAVALANGPGLLLADEPTSQLDTDARTQVLDLVDKAAERWGTTVIVVTHDPVVAARWPRTVTIRDGRVGAEGRHGRDLAVVGADGSLQLPDRLRRTWPAGTLVEIEEADDRLVLRREEHS